MNIRYPSPLSAAYPPHPSAAYEASGGMGQAAGRGHRQASRLSLLPQSEPQRLILKAFIGGAVSATLGALAAMGFVEGWKPLFPLLPVTFLTAALVQAYEVRDLLLDMADHERRVTDRNFRAMLRMADGIAQDRIEAAIQTVKGARVNEGTRAPSGAVAGDGGKCMSPAIDAPNVLRPQFPNFWRH